MTYSDVRSLPIQYRVWFINRVVQEIKKTNAVKTASDNSQPRRSAPGMTKDNPSTRIRRFT
jgi:hypothetical protein